MAFLSCVDERAEAERTGNYTFMIPVFWNAEERKFETEDHCIENLEDTEKEKQAQVMNYIKHKIARYFGTYRWLVDLVEDTPKFLVYQFNGWAIPENEAYPAGGFAETDNPHLISFEKARLPELLNETLRIV